MTHRIQNFSALASTELRRDALSILEAGLHAVETAPAVRALVKRAGDTVKVGKATYDLKKFQNVYVVAIGKAAFDAAQELEKILGSRITDGIVLDVKGGDLKRMSSRIGTHPFPSTKNMKATREIISLLERVTPDDLVIAVISGGGSALLCRPTQLSCADLTLLTKAMMHKGATIQEMNTVRKHISDVQGGQLAALVHPAKMIGLVFSDVPGDDLAMVASGPTFLDASTVAQAQAVLEKYDLLKACKLPSCELRETPKDPSLFKNVRNVMAVSATHAVEAMKAEAKKRGYRVRVLSTALTGEAREVGADMALAVRPGEALIACGETTVTLKGTGKGGRNQELALGALAAVPENGLVVSIDSDGIDHMPVAGAIADRVTRSKAKAKKLDASKSLADNDPYTFFKKINEHVRTGVTGLNVSDLMLAMREKR